MSFRQFLQQSIILENKATGRSKTGEPTFEAGQSLSGRVQRTQKTIVNKDKELTPIHAIIFVDPTVEPEIDAKITYNSTEYRVMAVEDVIGRNGSTHHYEVMAQLWSYET